MRFLYHVLINPYQEAPIIEEALKQYNSDS